MIRHDAFLDLAAVAIDFELSGAERSGLEAHLAACPACRRSADALRADARALAALPPERLSERRADQLLTAVLRPERTSYRSLRLLAVAALLAVLAVGSILVGAELLRESQQDDLSVLPSPPTSVAPDASTVVDNGVGMQWQRTTIPESDIPRPGGASMSGVIAGGPGAIAWGFVYGSEPRIWTTRDGRTWERATVPVPDDADPEYLEPGSVDTIVAGGPGFIATGHYYRLGTGHRTLVWTSVDGRTWVLQPHDPVLENAIVYDILPWRGELLAFGNWSSGPGGGATPAKLWSSRDGLTWQSEGLSLPSGLTMQFAVATSDRLWAIGGEEGADTGGGPAVILSSRDGRTWTRSELTHQGGRPFSVDGSLLTLVPPWPLPAPDFTPLPTPGGQLGPGLYRATDAAVWERVSHDLSAAAYDLAVVGGTLILVGDDSAGDTQCWQDCQAMGWRSVDGGATWQAVPADVVGGSMSAVAALADGTLVAVGQLVDEQGWPSPAGWVSPPARQPAASPGPTGVAEVARVVCQADGTTAALTPIVRPQADGVHVSTTNATNEERALDVEGIGGDNAGPGTTETVWAIEPGLVRVACYDSSAGPVPDDAWAELTVVDPDGTFLSTALDCTDASVGGGSYPAGAPGWVGDPVDLTRALLAGSHPEYIVEAAGYLMNDTRQVRVADGGRAIARLAWVTAGSDRWLLDGVTTCGGVDLGLDLSALAPPSETPVSSPGILAVTHGDETGSTWVELVRPDTGTVSPFSRGRDPGWVSDRLFIYTCAPQGGEPSTICTFDLTNAIEPEAETEIAQDAGRPAPAPDGSLIAIHRGSIDVGETWLMRPDGKDQRRLAAGSFLEWSPDGQWLLGQPESATFEVAVVRADGTDRDPEVLAVGYDPAWSPAGDRIAYAVSSELRVELRVMTPFTDVSETRYSASAASQLTAPAWLPDGRLVFVLDGDMYRLDAGSSKPVRLTTGLAIQVDLFGDALAVSPDGRSIAFSTGSGADSRVGIASVDGGYQMLDLGTGPITQPRWAPASFISVGAQFVDPG